MKNFSLIGNPLSHSISPLLHSSIFSQLGLDHSYELKELKKEDLESFVNSNRYFGYNVGDNPDEYQIKLDMVKSHESYSGKYILTDYTKSSTLNMFHSPQEVAIEVIVETNDGNDFEGIDGGNAWVVRPAEELLSMYNKELESSLVHDWAEEEICD